jgi:cytoskeletal protein CcmA (bactofilin family)
VRANKAYDHIFIFEGVDVALQTPFFSKRDSESATVRPTTSSPYGSGSSNASQSPMQTSSQQPSYASTQPGALAGTAPSVAKEGGSKLTVGPNIKLKGVEITDCDTLVVEGLVEATMDSRLMQISQQGAFKGSAEIDIAEIHGEFDGNLTVRQRLVIYATGKVTGKIRYGKVVIEEGGQLSGEIQFGATGATGAARPSTPKPALQAIA